MCKIWGRPFFELEVGLPQEVGLIFECIENGDWIGSDLVILETWSVLLMFLVAFCVILVKKYPETKKDKKNQKNPLTGNYIGQKQS